MLMFPSDLDGETAFCATEVDEGVVALPGELVGNGHGCTHADTGHRVHELLELRRIAVKGVEEAIATNGLVLWFTGAKCLGECAPERIEMGGGVVENSSCIQRLGA